MKTSRLAISCILLCTSLSPLPAWAQTDNASQNSERLDHIEHDLMLLQRQVSRDPSAVSTSGDATPVSGAAQLEVRLSTLEQEVRELRGKIEEDQFQVHKLSDTLDKMQRDMDFRFNELGGAAPAAGPGAPPGAGTPGAPLAAGAPPAAAPPGAPPADTGKPLDLTTKPPIKPLTDITAPPASSTQQSTAPDKQPPVSITQAPAQQTDNQISVTDTTPHAPDAATDPAKDAPVSFPTSHEHYNYAFRLLNQTQYDQAAAAFDSFTKKYPKDPLVGNAYYWEGQTYYIRRDYVTAADFFRQGFESTPDGPKAADNLLELARSLDALGRDKESCVVLQQISVKFKKTGSNAAQKADAEQKRIGCK